MWSLLWPNNLRAPAGGEPVSVGLTGEYRAHQDREDAAEFMAPGLLTEKELEAKPKNAGVQWLFQNLLSCIQSGTLS